MKPAPSIELNHTPVPLSESIQLRTILAPVDFSANAMFAFRYATRLAEKFGAKVIALNVLVNPVVYPVFKPEDQQEFVSQAQRRLYKVCRDGSRNSDNFETMVRVGVESLAEEINLAARDIAADLIVVPAHHRAILGRILFGDTVERIARCACCPVLMVPVPPHSPKITPALFLRHQT